MGFGTNLKGRFLSALHHISLYFTGLDSGQMLMVFGWSDFEVTHFGRSHIAFYAVACLFTQALSLKV